MRISKFIASIVSAGAILGFGSTSFAADMAASAPIYAKVPLPPAAVYDWTGLYLGGSVGGVRQQASTRYSSDPSFALFNDFAVALTTGTLASNSSQDGAGVLGGVTAGYDCQLSSLVYKHCSVRWVQLLRHQCPLLQRQYVQHAGGMDGWRRRRASFRLQLDREGGIPALRLGPRVLYRRRGFARISADRHRHAKPDREHTG